MKIVNGALVREQNENDVDDSCFDTSELDYMIQKLKEEGIFWNYPVLNMEQFIVDGKLQRHPQTKFWDDISSDQAHCYFLATGSFYQATLPLKQGEWPKTINGDYYSLGFMAQVTEHKLTFYAVLLFQWLLFWLPIRWCDGENPQIRFLGTKWNLGWKHWAGDYRLYINCLKDAPWWIRRLNRKKTLIRMGEIYWAKEPNIDWYLEIRRKFIEECL